MKRRFSTVVLALALLTALPATLLAQTTQPGTEQTQVPQPTEGGVNWGGAGYGAATVLCDVVYVPVKVLYAVLGGIVGGGAWALTGGNTQVANTVWRSSLGGDYVLTPDMLQGKRPINFSGPTETAPETSNTAAETPPAAPPAAIANSPAPSYVPSLGTSASQPIDRGSGPMPEPVEKSVE